MKTHVSFERTSTTLENDQLPFGRDIVMDIIASLKSQGLGDILLLEELDYAFTFYAPATTRECYVMAGFADDGVRQWLISCEPCRGIFSRWFRKFDDSGLQSVVLAIQHFLENDSAVSSIRWYTPDDWNNSPDDNWSDLPGR